MCSLESRYMDQNGVFMIGWEYPPHNSGGLGVACQGLTQALSDSGTNIHFSLPYAAPTDFSHMQVHGCVHPNWSTGASLSAPPFLAYSHEAIPQTVPHLDNSGYAFDLTKLRKLSSSDLDDKVSEYAQVVSEVGSQHSDEFGVIHAHDWMSFPAAVALKQETGKPIVAHVHSTEYDRAGLKQGNQFIEAIEYEGLHQADQVVAVSYYTKHLLEQQYGVDPRKISVVHNGIGPVIIPQEVNAFQFAQKRPVIVFMGRLTLQKGVTYFLDLAKAVLTQLPTALFVVAGSGDMYHELLFKTAADQLSANVLFSGFVRDEQKNRLLDRADVFVMPSVSEPFGLVALEAAQRNTPVIISKNTGVSEVLPSAIALDFWDIAKMSSSIVELVTDKKKSQQIVTRQLQDVAQQTWKSSAQKMKEVYSKAFLGR